MPVWFPALAAGAAAALVGKALTRYFNGRLGQSALVDPEGVRTVARFTAPEPAAVLRGVASALRTNVPLVATPDAVRGHTERGTVDLVRLAPAGDAYTLTLTRAWTGAQLDHRAFELLDQLHHALVDAGARQLTWHARQDRELAAPHPHPFY